MGLDLKETYLLLGSNLGERELILEKAICAIEKKIGLVFAKSSIYETEAWGKTDQPSFLNLAIGVKTILEPFHLLQGVLAIEEELGRIRHEKWGARLIDIDIIFYGEEIINLGEALKIPHPEMQNRKFVMQPLADIAPDFVHPMLKRSLSEILGTLTDTLYVEKK